jgi:hypothetical protein
VRIVLASVAALVVVMVMVLGGYFYINHVAAGVGRVPVMFVVSPSQTPAAPR